LAGWFTLAERVLSTLMACAASVPCWYWVPLWRTVSPVPVPVPPGARSLAGERKPGLAVARDVGAAAEDPEDEVEREED
jgi:hypothetical protein